MSTEPGAAEPIPNPGTPLLSVRGLVKHFPIRRGLLRRQIGTVRAVDGVSFEVGAHETVGLVGESGCGKSTLARLLMRLEDADSGAVAFVGEDALSRDAEQLRRYRRGVQMVFQDPFSSLNPRINVGEAIIRTWRINPDALPRAQWRTRARELLNLVGLDGDQAERFPHQLSGGQRQRVAIARALALSPKLVICDEPVSALDISIQTQVLALLRDLQDRLGVYYLFISHDLGVVRRISHRVVVMYLGRIVESGPAEKVFSRPAHPYTEALLSAIPVIDPKRRGLEGRILLQGDTAGAPPATGCCFRMRCPKAQAVCAEAQPALEAVDAGNHRAACYFPAPTGQD